MYVSERTSGEETTVIVVDALNFRRAGLTSLLDTWAVSLGLTLISVEDLETARSTACKLVIVNLGGEAIGDGDSGHWMEPLRDPLSKKSFVIISDREEVRDVLRAFTVGAQGFLPTSLKPELVLHALTFIFYGGSFFPPSVLLSFAHGLDSSDRRSGSGVRVQSPTSSHLPQAI